MSWKDHQDDAPARAGALELGRAAFFMLVPGLFLFLIDQTAVLWKEERRLQLISIAPYVMTLFLTGLFGHLLIKAAAMKKGDKFAVQLFLLIGAALSCLVAMFFSLLGMLSFQLVPILTIGCFIVYLVSWLAVRGEWFAGKTPAAVFAALFIVVPCWAIMCPERFVYPEPFHFAAQALQLSLSLGALSLSRSRLRPSFKADALAVFILIALIAAIHLGGGRALYYDSSPSVTAKASEPAGKGRPNIILIVLDTVRRDHLSTFGYSLDTSPNLSDFAKKSEVFERAESVASWTLPSHASMFTGLYPISHGSYNVPGGGPGWPSLAMDFDTLAERLGGLGYRSGAVSANYLLAGRNHNMDQGFEYFNDQHNPFFLGSDAHFHLSNFVVEKLQPRESADFLFIFKTTYMRAGQVNKKALTWLDSLDKDRPFFLFLNYMDAHQPYYPPGETASLFPGRVPELASLDPADFARKCKEEGRELSEIERAHLASSYDAEIRYLDGELGRLFAALDERGLFDDAMIIVLSDHGELLGERGGLMHPPEVFPELVNIPLMVKRPGSLGAGHNNETMDNAKIFYMIMHAAGSRVTEPSYPWAAAAMAFRDDKKGRLATYFGKFKFVVTFGTQEEELFNVAEDPAEVSNLIYLDPEERKRGRLLTTEFIKTVPKRAPAKPDKELTPEKIRELKALGYIR